MTFLSFFAILLIRTITVGFIFSDEFQLYGATEIYHRAKADTRV